MCPGGKKMKLSASFEVQPEALGKVARSLLRQGDKFRVPVHKAMAEQFQQCTFDNFGASGSFRPHSWAALSLNYARRVKRSYATLFVSGKLKGAIKAKANSERGRVSVSKSDCEYALAHQFGNPKGNLPDRPYFRFRTE
jgi:phage gpG-like protein